MHASDSPEILSSLDQGVQILHIRRPEKKNALTRAMYRTLADALRSMRQRALETQVMGTAGSAALDQLVAAVRHEQAVVEGTMREMAHIERGLVQLPTA